jgi:DNA-binding IclR family transcriptional regulator
MGWVEEPTRRGHYAVGLGLLHLGRAAMDQELHRRVATPVLRTLRDQTQMTVHLHVLRGLHQVCVERLDGRVLQGHGLRIGGTLPLHAGAGSRVLLAFSGEETEQRSRHAVLDRGHAQALTSKTPTTAREIDAHLRRILSTGVALSSEDNTYGVAAVARRSSPAPTGAPAAVSISCTPDNLADPGRRTSFVEAVRTAAATISDLHAHPVSTGSARAGWSGGAP